MNEEKYIIKTEDLTFTYFDGDIDEMDGTEIPALKALNLSVKKGEYISVLGHNGSGKSTLAKLLNLILIPTSGKIYVDGKDVSDAELSEDDVFEVRKKVGMVFQNPDNQIVATVVEEDVAFGAENLGLPREEIRRRVVNALNVVGMQDYARHAPHKLSGGQKQRIAIAGIIAMRPDCIILDEATAMLDPYGRREVMDTIEKLNKEQGITIIHITHYMEEAVRADRVIVINDSFVYMDGTPKEVFSRVDELKSVGLEAPQGTLLIHELQTEGFELPSGCISTEECSQALISFLKERTK